jgi:hypothetical protein
VIPFRRLRPLLIIVTAFTVAHSITLIASAFGYAPGSLWFAPLVETLVAVSIVYMALENIVGANVQRRWIIAFAFGLVHGFRILVRAARIAAVRRLPSADFTARVQCRRRARTIAGARAADSRAPAPVPLRRARTDGHHHPVGAGRAYSVALDDRARDRLASFPGRRSMRASLQAQCAG